jgi:ATP-binding protein involved in chromosome partitioning
MKTYHDIAGDGGSNVAAQVEAQGQAIALALAGVRRVVALASGKGGVGKSTLTMALARAWRRDGRRVAVLDADFNGPCQAAMAGLAGVPWLPGERGLALPNSRDGIGVVSLGSVLEDGRPVEIASVAPDEEQVWRATREIATLRQLLATVEWGELDALVVDLPPGTERTVQLAQVLGVLPVAVAFALVTIPSDLSRGVVARSAAALAAHGVRVVGYLENMDGYLCRGCGEVRPLFPHSAVELDLPCLGRIPFDPALAELGGGRTDDGAPPSAAIRAAARTIYDRLETS